MACSVLLMRRMLLVMELLMLMGVSELGRKLRMSEMQMVLVLVWVRL